MEDKGIINLVVIGHVDHGKSTLVGRLLFETGSVPQHVIDKFKREAQELGKATFEFAWVMDNLKEERERGVTIDISHKEFKTKQNQFTIIDAPGHRDFVKNMISGTSQADSGLLVVSVVDGPLAQTKEHLYLAKTMGVNQLIVVINKMDAVAYSKEKYLLIKEQLDSLLTTVGYKLDSIIYLPVSAYVGDNVSSKSDKLGWFEGNPLLYHLDNLKAPVQDKSKPLRLPVEDVYSIVGVGAIPVGRVETGVLVKGKNIIFQPSGQVGEVKSIEMHHKTYPEATPGMNVGFNVRGIKELVRGEVAGDVSSPPTVVEKNLNLKIIQ